MKEYKRDLKMWIRMRIEGHYGLHHEIGREREQKIIKDLEEIIERSDPPNSKNI